MQIFSFIWLCFLKYNLGTIIFMSVPQDFCNEKWKDRYIILLLQCKENCKPRDYRDFIDYMELFQSFWRLTSLFCYFIKLLWKRALKDRFKYVRRPIEDDEQVMKNKCKFGHRRGQTRKSLADIRHDEIKIAQMEVRLDL